MSPEIIPKDVKMVAEKALGQAMKLNLMTAKAFGLAKAAISLDPFAVADALFDLLTEQGAKPSVTVEQARDQIIAELSKTREEELLGRSNGLLSIFGQLLDDPRNMLNSGRLAGYLNDATFLFEELQVIMRNGDPARAETVAHLVPVYNAVTSSLIVGLSMGNYPVETIEGIYLQAIETNQALVTDGDQYGGYLYLHTIAQYGGYTCCGLPEGCYSCPVTEEGWGGCVLRNLVGTGQPPMCAGTIDESLLLQEHLRVDSDPTFYVIRRTVSDQQLALF